MTPKRSSPAEHVRRSTTRDTTHRLPREGHMLAGTNAPRPPRPAASSIIMIATAIPESDVPLPRPTPCMSLHLDTATMHCDAQSVRDRRSPHRSRSRSPSPMRAVPLPTVVIVQSTGCTVSYLQSRPKGAGVSWGVYRVIRPPSLCCVVCCSLKSFPSLPPSWTGPTTHLLSRITAF